ncbi:MAG: response regulator [Pseudomonadota bacterium]
MASPTDMRVLVIDDQLSMRTLIQNSLRELGFRQIETAADGMAGLETIIATRPHLVLTDYNMPHLDGLSVLKGVRSHKAIRNTAVFLLTGRSDQELVKRAVQFGVNNYLVKPFSTATLKSKIEDVFGVLA